MEKLDFVLDEIRRLGYIDATAYESIQQQISDYKLEKDAILEEFKHIIHKQSRKERTRKLIRLGAVVQKKLGIDLSREIDFKEIENSITLK